jgi:hypothetical protein
MLTLQYKFQKHFLGLYTTEPLFRHGSNPPRDPQPQPTSIDFMPCASTRSQSSHHQPIISLFSPPIVKIWRRLFRGLGVVPLKAQQYFILA